MAMSLRTFVSVSESSICNKIVTDSSGKVLSGIPSCPSMSAPSSLSLGSVLAHNRRAAPNTSGVPRYCRTITLSQAASSSSAARYRRINSSVGGPLGDDCATSLFQGSISALISRFVWFEDDGGVLSGLLIGGSLYMKSTQFFRHPSAFWSFLISSAILFFPAFLAASYNFCSSFFASVPAFRLLLAPLPQ